MEVCSTSVIPVTSPHCSGPEGQTEEWRGCNRPDSRAPSAQGLSLPGLGALRPLSHGPTPCRAQRGSGLPGPSPSWAEGLCCSPKGADQRGEASYRCPEFHPRRQWVRQESTDGSGNPTPTGLPSPFCEPTAPCHSSLPGPHLHLEALLDGPGPTQATAWKSVPFSHLPSKFPSGLLTPKRTVT